MEAWKAAFQSGFGSAFLQLLFDRFATFAWNEISLIWGVDDELRKLQRTFFKVQAVVDRVEASNMSSYNSSSDIAWQMWVEDLKKLSYDADDLLDKIELDLSHRSLDTNESSENQVRDMLLVKFKLTLAKEISEIQNKLESLAREMDSVPINEQVNPGSHDIASKLPAHSTFPETSSFLNDELVIGREHDKEEMLKLLMDDGLGRNIVSVVPIVGMCGIGKTTLARVLYNDEQVGKNFDLRIWVSVCVDFDVVKITKSMIESATQKTCKLSNLDPLQVKLRHILRGKRFLLVLDDVWNEKQGDWEVLCSPFRFGSKGSKVIVTTQSSIVSSIVGSVTGHHLKLLSDEHCWEVMQKIARVNEVAEIYDNMELIGRKIAKKCNGLPLAAKTLGSIMHFEFNEQSWDSILKSELWDLRSCNNDVFPALRLSYHHLPSHLQKCFAYCSMFPRDHEFDREDLVLRWMAEGFIRPLGEKRLEDIGNEYFNSLLFRSFFQVPHTNRIGKSLFKMHYLIHIVAQLVSTDMCFRVENGMPTTCHPLFRHARHLSLHICRGQHIRSESFHGNQRLRTLQISCENGVPICRIPDDLLPKLRVLRVLDLGCIGLNELSDSIDELKLLRYLNLSENRIQKLPESICNLSALQTLRLRNCHDLLGLPLNFRNLINLRHLELDFKCRPELMPLGIGMLTGLQKLDAFIVGRNEGCGIQELKNMNSLQGSICIRNLENVSGVQDAQEAMLGSKLLLDRLELEWSAGAGSGEEVLQGLKPAENLKELVIINYCGSMFPDWLSDSHCKLTSIRLQGIVNCFLLPSLGQLPYLKFLYIEDMSGLEKANHHFRGFGHNIGFPSLESLIFSGMPNWKKWINLKSNDMPCLRKLEIVDCPVLISVPSLSSLRSLWNLEFSRCPELKSLPGLPASLTTLIIHESAFLEVRCKEEGGADWPMIRGISNVIID